MSEIRHICFDLGGVLVRIGTHWGQMATHAGIAHQLDPDMARMDFPPFVRYEEGLIPYEEYLRELAGLLGISVQEAARTHAYMLIEPYPGGPELVADVHAKGLSTGCLSNTNAPHWAELRESDRFPAIRDLQVAMGSFQVNLAKPDAGIFRVYEWTFGVKPEEIAYFDDAPANVHAALSCGWNATLIDPTGDPPGQIRRRLRELNAL